MKIAIDARLAFGTSTGDSTYWTCLLLAFAKHSDLDCLTFVSNASPPALVPPEIARRWHVLPGNNQRLWSLWTFPRWVNQNGAVAHVQYSVSPLLKNSISTVHDVSFCVDPSWFTYRDRILLKLGVSSAAKRASAVITVSQTSKKEIERHFNQAKGKVKAIYNACPTWVQKQDPFVARSIVQSLGITGPYVLTVGTDWARKNMKLAVESMRKVSKEHEHRLVITGKGSGELDDFVLRTGYVSNEVLGALYSCADIYLAPSLHEGFGIPILEAFRCGTPVLCGSGGAMPEVAGGAAVVAADYSVASWVSSIHELLSTPSKLSSLVRAGTSREHDFSWDRAANETMEVYREVWSRLTKER